MDATPRAHPLTIPYTLGVELHRLKGGRVLCLRVGRWGGPGLVYTKLGQPSWRAGEYRSARARQNSHSAPFHRRTYALCPFRDLTKDSLRHLALRGDTVYRSTDKLQVRRQSGIASTCILQP